MHGTKADKLYDSTQLLDVKAQLDLGECGMQEVSFYHQHKNNVDFVFVDHPVYHRPGELVITAVVNYIVISKFYVITNQLPCIRTAITQDELCPTHDKYIVLVSVVLISVAVVWL